MPLVRRLALSILSWVVWQASPERREWAEGLEREVAFIEGDWRALGWAIGSVRVLFTSRESRDATLADVRTAARTISRQRGKRRILSAFWILPCIGVGWLMQDATSKVQRDASWVLILMLVCAAVSSVIEGRALPALKRDDLNSCIAYYRAELERVLDQHRSGRWLVAPALCTVVCTVWVFAFSADPLKHPLSLTPVLAIGVTVTALGVRERRVVQRRMKWLYGLLAETH